MATQSEAIALTNAMMDDFFNLGKMTGITERFTSDVVVFRTGCSQYVRGREDAARFLQDMYAKLAPCRIDQLKFHEQETEDGCSVQMDVGFWWGDPPTAGHSSTTVMYRRMEGELRVSGLHMDVAMQKKTHQPILSKLQGGPEAQAGNLAQLLNVVRSDLRCAYIVYAWDDGTHRLYEYGDELWKLLGYRSRQEFQSVTKEEYEPLIYQGERHRVRGEIEGQLQYREVYQVEYRLKNLAGGMLWVLECGQCIEEDDGTRLFHSFVLDITPLERTSESLRYRMSYDELTGLNNTVAFYQLAKELIVQNPETEFEIMVIDIERFRIINDLFGSKTGDDLLKYIASFFRNVNLPLSAFGRFHADHFAACYPSTESNRKRFVDSLQRIASSFVLDYVVIMRFGVYQVKDRTLPISAMCDRATLALKEAKHDNTIVCGEYDEGVRRRLVDEQAIMNTMESALANEEFVVYLQPKYDLATENIIGAEALVRWQHPAKGFISPGIFIPVFERNGFIFKLDQYIWEKTCQILADSIRDGKHPLPISVNVSRVDLYHRDIVSILTRLVQKYDIPARLLELEITESAYMDNAEQIIALVKELKEAGFRILMDDFGSGYSSLNMLRDMPVDILKIDLRFLDSSDQSGRGGSILNSVIRMAKWLRMPVVAEGVETRAQADFLRTIGCNYAQGFYYSRPIPVPKYEELLASSDFTPEEEMGPSASAADLDELLNPNTQLNLLFNSVTGGIGLYELTGDKLTLLRANSGFQEMLGDKEEHLYDVERNVLDRLHAEDRNRFKRTIQQARETGHVVHCRLRVMREDGEILWLSAKVSFILTEKDRQLFYLALEDVTELQKTVKDMRSLMDNMPGGFGMYELIGDDVYIRSYSRWLHDLNPEELEQALKKNGGKLNGNVPDDYLNDTRNAILRSFEEKRVLSVDYPFVTREGKEIQIRVMVNTPHCEDEVYRSYAFVHEISN